MVQTYVHSVHDFRHDSAKLMQASLALAAPKILARRAFNMWFKVQTFGTVYLLNPPNLLEDKRHADHALIAKDVIQA